MDDRRTYIPRDPASELELPRVGYKLPNVLNKEEAELVLQQPNLQRSLGIRDRAFLEMLYSTGIRRMELLQLKLYDVDKKHELVTIREGKGRRDRVVPIGELALFWFEQYLSASRAKIVREPDESVAFLTAAGEPFSPNHLSWLARQYLKDARIGKSGVCHIFRWGRVEASEPNQIWQADMTKIWAGPAVGWAYLVSVIDCCTREIVGWNLSQRCRTADTLVAVEQAVLERLPSGSRSASLTLTTDNGTQFTSSRFLETLGRLGITHRRTAYHHPEGNSYIERFHRSLKEEEVWTAEYRSLEEARASIARWIEEYNHDRPHRGIENRTPREAFLGFCRSN